MAQDQTKKRSNSTSKRTSSSSASSSHGSANGSTNSSSSTGKAGANAANATTASGATGNSLACTKALNPNKQLHELLKSIEPRYVFHPAVEELLLDMATQFVDDVVDFSSKICKHRRSTMCEPKDLQFCLAKNYGISLAGVVNANALAGSSSSSCSSSGATTTTTTISTATTPSVAAAAANDASSLNALGTDVLVRSRPLKNSIHMHRMTLKRKTLMKAKQPKTKSHRSTNRTAA